MALPSNIPTSFVPHPSERQHFRTDFSGVLPFLAYLILGVSVVLAVGVFFYSRVLTAQQAGKDAQLADAQKTINQDSVQQFVDLRDRLIDAQSLLDSHVAFSNILAALDAQLPQTVLLKNLSLSTDAGTGAITLQASGVAKTFNALASASDSFASSGTIKDAIFSGINVNTDNSVSFAVNANIDPKLLVYTPQQAAPSATESTTATDTVESTAETGSTTPATTSPQTP